MSIDDQAPETPLPHRLLLLAVPGVPELRRAYVRESSARGCVVTWSGGRLAAGTPVRAYYLRGRMFVCRTTQVLAEPHHWTLNLGAFGEEVVAEERVAYRVHVPRGRFIGSVDGQDRPRVLDVSPQGLGYLTRRGPRLGEMIEVEVRGSVRGIGAAEVRSVTSTQLGAWRVGLQIDPLATDLGQAMAVLCADLQRELLAERSGRALRT